MVRIAYFHNECAPYRMAIFKGISELPNTTLKVYFGRYRSSNRKWRVQLSDDFGYEVLNELYLFSQIFSLNPDEDPNPLNLSLPLKLLRGRYDVFVGGEHHYFGSIMAFLVSKICRKPFILFLEDIDSTGAEISSYLGRFQKHWFKRAFQFPLISARFICSLYLLKHSSCYVVPGTAAKKYLLRRGVDTSKIFMAWNVIDNTAFEHLYNESLKKNRRQENQKSMNTSGKPIILSVAYLSERKGLQYLIQACARLKQKGVDFTLVIVGQGSYEQELRELSIKSGVDTEFKGYVPNIVDFYVAADVFVLPTLQDVWGFVINEAMVCGCPIVATRDSGASADLVKNGVNGYVVESRNVEQLSEAISTILSNAHLRSEMKKASRRIIRDFTYETNLQGYKDAFEYVTSGQKSYRKD